MLTPSKILTTGALLLSASFQIHAHGVWLEQGTDNSVKVFYGEPGEPESGDAINNLKTAKVYVSDISTTYPISQEADYWETTVTEDGDVRLYTADVWQPWEMESSQWWRFWEEAPLQGAIVEAKLGRSETAPKMILEFVPTSANSDEFTLVFEGKPVANASYWIVPPDGEETEMKTDENGKLTVDTTKEGQYMLIGLNTVDRAAQHSGKEVASLMYISSLTFVSE